MLNRIRERFGTAGLVVSIMALVLALGGAAFAAGGLNALQKKQVKAIAKSLQGTGPAGPAGPAGANGANGKDGKDGANGRDGTNGTSVTTTPEAPGGNCGVQQAGVKLTSASGVNYVCDGANGTQGSEGDRGDPWTAGGTLPANATQTGTWVLNAAPDQEIAAFGEVVFESISFPIPLDDPPTVHFQTDADFGDFCTGSHEDPTAPSGHLCMYKDTLAFQTANVSFVGFSDWSGNPGATTTGALLLFAITNTSPGVAAGSWAVTG